MAKLFILLGLLLGLGCARENYEIDCTRLDGTWQYGVDEDRVIVHCPDRSTKEEVEHHRHDHHEWSDRVRRGHR